MSLNLYDPFAHGAYLLWSGGSLKFDVVEEEEVERDADIVEHPVETGANVADHYRIKLRNINLNAFVTQEPIDPTLYPAGGGSVQLVEYSLPSYPLRTAQTVVTGDPTVALGTLLALSPPTTFIDKALVYSSPVDTLAQVLGVLDGLYQNATLIDVATRSYYYAQHLLGPVRTRRNKETGTGTIIELQLRQVVFVSTQAVQAPPAPAQKKDAPKTDKGKQQPTAPLQSLSVKGLLGLGILN